MEAHKEHDLDSPLTDSCYGWVRDSMAELLAGNIWGDGIVVEAAAVVQGLSRDRRVLEMQIRSENVREEDMSNLEMSHEKEPLRVILDVLGLNRPRRRHRMRACVEVELWSQVE